ncbi:probable cytochrome P450 6g2 [Episyrphus balteatus]|uniref:probable cytochrome P450 6g2 n=1 Tax=Episyrphus balteatus TaxID=286459 RepID=UPI0024867CAD|nr:probable cytochrome P450 6g2 [Episyrphus balteatus]
MLSLTELLLLVISILFGGYIWTKYNLLYWRRKNVPFVEPNILLGNLVDMLKFTQSSAENLQQMYNHKNAQDQPVLGIYILSKPALLIREPELIKSILVKNFNKFSNRYATTDEKGDTLGSGTLFFIKNPHWRELRTKLTPVFSSGKIKQMFPLMQDVGNELDKYLSNIEIDKDNSFVQEVKEVCAAYTTDVIATVAFGIQANSLRNPDADFRKHGRNIVDFTLSRAIELTGVFFIPVLAKLMRCKIFPKESATFIRKTINYVMNERIKNGNTRNDLIDVLIAFKKSAEIDKDMDNLAMSNEILVAQAAIFFVAGYETSSATMSFCLYELTKSVEVQKRLRGEIKEVLKANDGKITYEAVNEMEYLNMVVLEVLRLYPPLPFLDRTCTLPSGEKEFSFKPELDLDIPNHMGVFIPMFGIQRDSKFFPNPDQFDPERFSAQNKANIKPFTYMPFGLGPHSCIGERFGLVQVKIGLISILRNHYVTDCDKSYSKMIFNPKAMVLQSKDGIFCKFVRDPLV